MGHDDATRFECLATGYGLAEAPRVDTDDRLYWSDANEGGVYRRDPGGTIETIVPKRRGIGGLALHAEGGVVVTGRDVCHVRDGASRTVFAAEDVPGFNDLTVDARGRILVGTLRSHTIGPGGESGELLRIDERGDATELYANVGMSNGLGFSPGGRILYHSDSARGEVLAHDLDEDGRCTGRRVLARIPRGVPDGLAVDEAGGVWVAAYGGGCVVRITPDGEIDRQLAVPAKIVTSLCFGGDDRRDLYVTTADNTTDPSLRGSVFRGRIDVPGLPVPRAVV